MQEDGIVESIYLTESEKAIYSLLRARVIWEETLVWVWIQLKLQGEKKVPLVAFMN